MCKKKQKIKKKSNGERDRKIEREREGERKGENRDNWIWSPPFRGFLQIKYKFCGRNLPKRQKINRVEVITFSLSALSQYFITSNCYVVLSLPKIQFLIEK